MIVEYGQDHNTDFTRILYQRPKMFQTHKPKLTLSKDHANNSKEDVHT